MGRCADDCGVEAAIRRGEKPESYNDWLKSTIEAGEAASRHLAAFNAYFSSAEFQKARKAVRDFHKPLFAKD